MKDFVETNHRTLSRYRIVKHMILDFVKHNCRLMNAGESKEERREPL